MVRSGNEVQVADEFGTGSGRIVLTASSATEYAFEGGQLTRSDGQPSVFTSALVAGLESGEADLDADGEISVDELYDYTYRKVRDSTPGQAPMKWSFGVEGSLVVARSVRPASLPDSIRDDLASDRVVLRLEGVRGLEQIVRSGKPGLRAAALQELARLGDRDDSLRVRRAADAVLAPAGVPADQPGAAVGATDDDQGANEPEPLIEPARRAPAVLHTEPDRSAPVSAAVVPPGPRTPAQRAPEPEASRPSPLQRQPPGRPRPGRVTSGPVRRRRGSAGSPARC